MRSVIAAMVVAVMVISSASGAEKAILLTKTELETIMKNLNLMPVVSEPPPDLNITVWIS